MKKVVQLPAIASEGRFANRLVHYIVGKCYAEAIGATVEIPNGWLGETIFEINDPHINGRSGATILPPFFNLPHRLVDPCLTRANVKRFLRWRPGWVRVTRRDRAAVHVRRGDYMTDGNFPIVSEVDLCLEASRFGNQCELVREDKPQSTGLFPDGIDFLEDFQRLMTAENVFVYPRSTFSQVAALLGDGNIYMPFGYVAGQSSCKFKLADTEQPVVFPTKNNNLL